VLEQPALKARNTATVSGPKVLKLVRLQTISASGDDGEPVMAFLLPEEMGQPEFRFFETEIAESTRSRRSDHRFVEGGTSSLAQPVAPSRQDICSGPENSTSSIPRPHRLGLRRP
jgi:hypothetical protein